MTGKFASRAPAGKPRCARCGRPFTPKSEGQRYGLKCARKMTAQEAVERDILETRHTVIV